ncbi:MAG TPA: hypothetical protein DDW52_29690 [Planctomycetaceae bacterium]|nr:hypothetical protein [Planctomycetaceae bacterium]
MPAKPRSLNALVSWNLHWPGKPFVVLLMSLLASLGAFTAGSQARAQNRSARSDYVVEPAPELKHRLYMRPAVAQVRATLRQPAGFQLTGTPLAEALASIGQGYRCNIWLDRRIDPNITINLRGGGKPLGSVLESIARLANAEMSVVENVVYIGPPTVPSRVAAASASLYDELHSARHAAANRSADLKWLEATTPDEILGQLRLKLPASADGSVLPYDLWRAGEFYRESSIATLLCVIAAGFEREFVLASSRSSAQLVTAPLRSEVQWTALVPKGTLNNAQLTELKGTRGALLVGGRDSWKLTGDFSVHLLASSGFASQRRPRPGGPRDARSAAPSRVSGDIAGPLDDVVRQLSAMNGYEVSWDGDIPEKERTQSIKIRVENASFEDILGELSSASNLSLRLDEQTVSVARVR